MRTNNTTKMRTLLIGAAVGLSALVIAPALPAAAQAGQIPDEGLPAAPIAASALVSERTEVLAAGVTGINSNNDSFPNTNIRVTSFAEIGDTMYVGGKFTQVEIAATGTKHNQPFLAAFNRTTGEWIDTFRPTLDGNVWDLKATDDGRLIVAGQFTNVNGESNTTSVAMLNATTGAVDPTWRVSLTLTGSSERALARALDIEGNKLYIGGNFTKIRGTNGTEANAGRIARVTLSTGNVDGAFLPNIDGIVFDIDATSDRVYAVGNFFYVNGTWSIGMAAMQPNGQPVPNLQPWVRTHLANTRNSYQQAILALGDDVWQVGAQHNRQVYNKSDYGLIRSWVSDPWGDGQALAHLNGFVYSGSHANGGTLLYRDATSWPGLTGATGSKPIRWMTAFDATAREQVTWYPQIGTQYGEGSWELFGDSTGCLWTGGDFNRGSYDGSVPRYVGGFAKFCAADSTPPAPPTSPTAQAVSNGINLAWEASTGDDRGGMVRYELLKNDSVFASYIGITTFRDPVGTSTDRYFVRSMDYTGNRSATTQVFTAGENDTTRPSTPQDLVGTIEANGDVALTWTASTDNIAVTEYIVYRNAVEIARVTDPAYVVSAPATGDHWYQVRALDAAGNESFKTPSTKITIAGADVTAPTTPQNLTSQVGPRLDVELTWTASTDDVGLLGYIIYRNGQIVTDAVGDPAATTQVVPNPGPGDHWFQVQAIDTSDNFSFKTAPIMITIEGPDVTKPSTPQNLAGVLEANGDVTLTWTPSTDNVAVTGYIVYRNGAIIANVTDATAVIPAVAQGTHWYQVRAIDAAGNESWKTPSLAFVVQGPDAEAPNTPRDLAAVIEANGDVTLTWTPSTDNVAVTGYIVYRNGVVIANVTGATAVIPAVAAGSHFYQVRATDAAGNQSFKTPPLRIDI